MPTFEPEHIRRLLELSGATLTRSVRGAELEAIEERFGFRFGADHRELLAVALPVGRSWPDWKVVVATAPMGPVRRRIPFWSQLAEDRRDEL